MSDASSEPTDRQARVILLSREGKTPEQISQIVGISKRQIQRIRAEWIDRWKPHVAPVLTQVEAEATVPPSPFDDADQRPLTLGEAAAMVRITFQRGLGKGDLAAILTFAAKVFELQHEHDERAQAGTVDSPAFQAFLDSLGGDAASPP